MPKDAWEKLPTEKRAAIESAAMDEFVSAGYEQASTNAIVKAAGISKGSLFYYFKGKADLYIYLIQRAQASASADFELFRGEWPADAIDRMRTLVEIGLKVHARNPKRARFLETLLDAPEMQQRLGGGMLMDGRQLFEAWFADADTSRLRVNLSTMISLLYWTYTGLKMELLASNSGTGEHGKGSDIPGIVDQMLQRFDKVIDALRWGTYERDTGQGDHNGKS